MRNKHSGFETSKDFEMVGDTLDFRHFVAEMFRRTKDDFIVPVHNELDFKNHDFLGPLQRYSELRRNENDTTMIRAALLCDP